VHPAASYASNIFLACRDVTADDNLLYNMAAIWDDQILGAKLHKIATSYRLILPPTSDACLLITRALAVSRNILWVLRARPTKRRKLHSIAHGPDLERPFILL
jgi:hypothetical protein